MTWQVDVDHSGELDFDEFVTMVRRLKPKGSSKNHRAAGVAAFDAFTRNRHGRARLLRRAVPGPRRGEAGALGLVLSDFGFDDEQLISILSAIYPPPWPVPDKAPTGGSKPGKPATGSSSSSSKSPSKGGGSGGSGATPADRAAAARARAHCCSTARHASKLPTASRPRRLLTSWRYSLRPSALADGHRKCSHSSHHARV
jgi:hypothetical protein